MNTLVQAYNFALKVEQKLQDKKDDIAVQNLESEPTESEMLVQYKTRKQHVPLQRPTLT